MGNSLKWDRSTNSCGEHRFSAEECETQVREAVFVCTCEFSQNKRKLRDLSPRFWVALLDLEVAASLLTAADLIAEFPNAYKQLGAPGDFGYGTPCGDALANLYDWWNAWCTARKRVAVATP